MKQQIKSFIAGVIITAVLFSLTFAAPVTKSIKVIVNTLNIKVNEKVVKFDTIIYNKTLYAPVKTIAESLEKDFTWNTKTNAVTIKDKNIPSQTTPASSRTNGTSISAIDFTLPDLNGKLVKLSDYKGKKIFLNFWATWCAPCRYEMPFIQQLSQEIKNEDFVVLTVNIQEPQATIQKFMQNNNYKFTVLLDTKGEVADAYQIQGIPLSLLIDKDFNIVASHEGSMSDYEMLKKFINQPNE